MEPNRLASLEELRAKAADGTLTPEDLLQVSKLRSARKPPTMAEPVDRYLAQIGTMVRAFRLKKNWSLGDFADQAGLDRSYISQVETGHLITINLRNMLKLAEGCSKELIIEFRTKRKRKVKNGQ